MFIYCFADRTSETVRHHNGKCLKFLVDVDGNVDRGICISRYAKKNGQVLLKVVHMKFTQF